MECLQVLLQRKQIIHPIAYLDNHIREKIQLFWGDMRNIPKYRLDYEDELFPTAQSMIAELLKRDSNYSLNHLNENKIKYYYPPKWKIDIKI